MAFSLCLYRVWDELLWFQGPLLAMGSFAFSVAFMPLAIYFLAAFAAFWIFRVVETWLQARTIAAQATRSIQDAQVRTDPRSDRHRSHRSLHHRYRSYKIQDKHIQIAQIKKTMLKWIPTKNRVSAGCCLQLCILSCWANVWCPGTLTFILSIKSILVLWY